MVFGFCLKNILMWQKSESNFECFVFEVVINVFVLKREKKKEKALTKYF